MGQPRFAPVFRLAAFREMMHEQFDRLADRDGAYGSYRGGIGRRPDLYASLDIAIMRTIMGEPLRQTLTGQQRRQWCEHINSFALYYFHRPTDGSYFDGRGHGALHVNGMVIGALGPLGGKQKHPCRLYDPFDTPEKVAHWLDTQIDYTLLWSESHRFWGGMHCFSFSSHCTPDWRAAVFDWLDAEADPATGWWRRGIAPANASQPLGGAVHILPIYEHHDRPFPYPRQILDSTLALQLPNDRWLPGANVLMDYLDLDALYILATVSTWLPDYRRDDILDAARRYAAVVRNYLDARREDFLALHPHHHLAAAGILGLLQRLLPDQFVDDVQWTDIFSDRRLYQTHQVEVFDPAPP